jgi:YidC/Oxa1 family membrane protein insertase
VDILIVPLVNMLLFLYGVFGNSFVMAIIISTILIRMITLPLTLPQQRNSRKMAELAPQLEELKKKYGNDRAKMSQAQMELYKQNNVNMFGGCLPLILQLVVMIAFYQSLTRALSTNPLQLLQLQVMPALVPLIPINANWLIYDLGLPGILPAVQQAVSPLVAQLLVFILPVLVVGTTYLSQKLMATPSADPSQASMTKQMNLIMPMMFGLFALQFAAGLSIYFIVSNVVGAAQSWLMNRRWKKQPLISATEPVKVSKGSKPVAALEPPAKSKKSTPLPKPAVDDDDQPVAALEPPAKSKKSTSSPKPAADDDDKAVVAPEPSAKSKESSSSSKSGSDNGDKPK